MTVKESADKLLAKFNHAKQQIRDEKTNLDIAKARLVTAEEAQRAIQKIAQKVERRAHSRIVNSVSKSLEAIFPEPYEFEILFERKRGKTEARLVFIRNGKEVDPLKASGMGPAQIAAFALRTAEIKLSRPSRRSFIALDEPFNSLHKSLDSKIRAMLTMLSKELDIQFVLTTLNPDLQVGKIIHVEPS